MYSNTKFHVNPSSGSRVVPRGQTDGHDGANSRLSLFRKRAYKRSTLKLTDPEAFMATGSDECLQATDRLLELLTSPKFRRLVLCPSSGYDAINTLQHNETGSLWNVEYLFRVDTIYRPKLITKVEGETWVTCQKTCFRSEDFVLGSGFIPSTADVTVDMILKNLLTAVGLPPGGSSTVQ